MAVDVKDVMEILEGRLAMVCLGEEVPVVWRGRGGLAMFCRGRWELPMVWQVELMEDLEMVELLMVLSLERGCWNILH